MAVSKEVKLERAINKITGETGSFGFSLMGGAMAKIPAVVCNVEPDGSAAVSQQIMIGDRLTHLNGEDLTELISRELVSRIRSAPSPSKFTFSEDAELKERVYHILHRQEEKRKREKMSSSNSEGSLRSGDRSPSHVAARRGLLPVTKELEIETSVNTAQPGEVVKVRAGKITGKVTGEPMEGTMQVPTVNIEQRSIDSSGSSSSLGVGGAGTEPHPSEQPEIVVPTIRPLTGDTSHANKNGLVLAVDEDDKLTNQSQDDDKRSSDDSPSQERVPSINGSETPVSQESKKKRTTPSKTQQDQYSRAIILARQLFMLDGYKKSDIVSKLADTSEFGQIVAREYLKFFEFDSMTLDDSLRQFLVSFTLTGETHERERIMVYFSERFFETNPYSYPSFDTVHGITCALLLLNSDLHTDHGGPKMAFSQFVSNLGEINIRLPKDQTKRMYDSIKRKPLESGIDEVNDSLENSLETDVTDRIYHVLIPGTFVEVELPESAPLFKEGFLLRKNIMDGPHKKVARGKRQWKTYYAYLKGFLLYFVPPNGQLHYADTSNAIVITHCLAMTAADYQKKNTVLRVTTSDWHAFLLQANNFNDLQQWIYSINRAAATYSAPPLAAPIASGRGFQRPTFPLAPTKNTLDQQKEIHELRAKSIEKELQEHQAYRKTATRNKISAEWFEKLEFLQFEINRFRIYLGSLHSESMTVDFLGPLPTGLIPSPSISTLATSGVGDELLFDQRRSRGQSPLLFDSTDSPKRTTINASPRRRADSSQSDTFHKT